MLHTMPTEILLVDRDGTKLVQNKRMSELWAILD
jgi:hypothetical protein